MLTSHLHCSCFASAFVLALVKLHRQAAMASKTMLVGILDHICMPDCKSKRVSNFLHHSLTMSEGFKKLRQAASQFVALTSSLCLSVACALRSRGLEMLLTGSRSGWGRADMIWTSALQLTELSAQFFQSHRLTNSHDS